MARFWVIVGLVVVAVGAFTLAVLGTAAPASCSSADDSRTAGLLLQSANDYASILSSEPTSNCAAAGMVALCADATELEHQHLTLEANDVYKAMFEHEPAVVEAKIGAAKANIEAKTKSDVKANPGVNPTTSITTVACAEAGEKRTATVPRTTTIVSGPPGPQGPPGKNGLNGRNGFNGRNGNIGRNGVNGLNGQNGRNGVNGVNGQNGRNGINGVNGQNGRNGINGRNGVNGQNGRNGSNGLNGANGTNGAGGMPSGDCDNDKGCGFTG